MGNVDLSVVASTAGRDMRLDGGMGGEEEEGVSKMSRGRFAIM